MTVGTDLEIIPPARSEILGADAERLPTLQTTAKSDADLVAVWLKSHADGSPHTLRAYERIELQVIGRTSPCLQISARALVRSRMGIDAGRLRVRMPEVL